MRVSCQHCGQSQPLDWRSGDLCVHCGKTPRSDQRCYWCVNWVPPGGFCRSCGAPGIDRRHFGPARMLKDGGVDRYAIPKMLKEWDDDSLENLDRIYQRHAGIVARHADDALFLLPFLFEKHWSGDVEDSLTAELPWPPGRLARMETFPARLDDPRKRARLLAAETPVPLVRKLAQIARLRLDDWEAFSEVLSLASEKEVAAEAVFAVTGWRVRYGVEMNSRLITPEMRETLRQSPFTAAARVRLAWLGEREEIPPDAISSDDPDIAIPAAILREDSGRLKAALNGDSLQQRAAGIALARMGELPALANVLREGSDEVRREILDTLSALKQGSPDLRAPLLEIVENHEDGRMRDRAAHVLCKAAADIDAMPLVRADNGAGRIVHSVLVSNSFSVGKMEEVLTWLVENRRFRGDQFGMATVAEKAKVSDAFVPRCFPLADDETKIELCHLAEKQLEQRGDPGLVRFLLRVAFGPPPAGLRHAAFWSLRRCYLRKDPRGELPARLSLPECREHFGSYREFCVRLAKMLEDPDTHSDTSICEELERILRYPELSALHSDEEGSWRLAKAVCEVMADPNARYTLRGEGASFLGKLGQHDPWRGRAIRTLESFLHGDLDYHCRSAIESLTREPVRSHTQSPPMFHRPDTD